MKRIMLIFFLALSIKGFAQDRKLKNPQPNLVELMQFEIRIHPNDTIFNRVDFSYLPVKGFPFFTADLSIPNYKLHQRDSIISKINSLFYEE